MTDLFDPIRPGASARREADRLAAARLRRGEPADAASSWERGFSQGAQGEERLGWTLNVEARRGGGVAVLHDLVLPDRKANIDHLVVGPAGVTVIDAKAWNGRIWVGRAVIGQGRRARRKPIDGMSRQLHRVHTALSAAGRDDVAVEVAVCFVNENRGLSPHQLHKVEGVNVGLPQPVIEHALRPGRHDLGDVLAISELLAAYFIVQGGVLLPTGPAVPRFRSESEPVRPSRRRPRKRVSRPRRPVSRRTRRSRRAAVSGLVRVAILAVGVQFLAGMLKPTAGTSPLPFAKLSRQQLVPLLPAVRQVARNRAHGGVRRVAITSRANRFVVRFRHGRSCVVTVTVPRTATSPLASVRVSTRRCGR